MYEKWKLRHQNNRCPPLGVHVAQDIPYQLTAQRIKIARRLVENQNGWRASRRYGQAQQAALAAGQPRVVRAPQVANLPQVEHLLAGLLRRGPAQPAQVGGVVDGFVNGEVVERRSVLGSVAHAQGDERGIALDILAVEADAARRAAQQVDHLAREGRPTRAVVAEQAEHLTLLHLERQVIVGRLRLAGVVFDEILDVVDDHVLVR